MLAVAFGFMLHNRKVEKQKFSELVVHFLETKLTVGWENHRFDCHLRVNRGYCYNILTSNTASFSSDEPSVWDSKFEDYYDCSLIINCSCIYKYGNAWNGRSF